MGMRYTDFVDLRYEPSETDLICSFHIEPWDISLEEAAGGVAAESSIGTWTEVATVQPYVKRLRATVFKIDRTEVEIAYPIELFELGNMPNLLSSIAGNIFGLGAVKHLRLNDVRFPRRLVRSFMGPEHGVQGVRHLLGVRERPLVGTIIKPKLGLRAKDHAKVAYEAWIGGCDLVKDDENLSSQKFNAFEDRLKVTLEMRDRAEDETGEKKAYMANVTAETEEMLRRAETVKARDGTHAMIDIITCGFCAFQTLRKRRLGLIIHAHRAGHAAFTRDEKHGIAMKVIAKAARIVGADQLHVGTVVGKMSETRTDVLQNVDALRQPLYSTKTVFPVASGGLHPALVPDLLDIFGKDLIIQAGGGIHGHPGGTVKGAAAMRQAVEAAMQGQTLREFAKKHEELAVALETWRR